MITITIEQDNSGSHEDEGTYESVQAAIQQKPLQSLLLGCAAACVRRGRLPHRHVAAVDFMGHGKLMVVADGSLAASLPRHTVTSSALSPSSAALLASETVTVYPQLPTVKSQESAYEYRPAMRTAMSGRHQ